MKVLVTGAGGQVGRELARTAPPGVAVVLLTSGDCDIGDLPAVSEALAREQPDVIINAAAYTAVDRAESEPDMAERVNARGPAHLAAAAGTARLLHISTDFVFDGERGRPWRPADPANPLSVYGRTKLAGEAPVLALGERGLVLRTSWVYSQFGSNFVKTMLKMMSSRPAVRVVQDQIGAPTWAHGLALALWRSVELPDLHGIHHWRDAGAASWYDFAVAIAEDGFALGLLPQQVTVQPINATEYPTPARRPAFSLLDCSATWAELGVMPQHWRRNLLQMLKSLG